MSSSGSKKVTFLGASFLVRGACRSMERGCGMDFARGALAEAQAFLAWPWAVDVVLCWSLLQLALLWVLVAPSCPVAARTVSLRVDDWE